MPADGRLRVTLVIPSLAAGGAERVVATLATCWHEAGWEVTVVTLAGEERPPYYPLPQGVVLRQLGCQWESPTAAQAVWNNLRRLVLLRRALAAHRPAVVVGFMPRTNVLTVLASWGKTWGIIVTEHHDPAQQSFSALWQWLRRQAYHRANTITLLTESARSFFPSRLQPRIRIMPNPIVLPAIPPPPPSKTIVGVGRLVPQKGFDLLLQAFARCADGHPEWSLVIWGEGPDRPMLLELAQQLGVAERVRLPGLSQVPGGWLQEAGIFVLSSRHEGLSNVLIEAMMTGLPVVATDCPSGPADIVNDGRDGLLVPNEDVSAMAEAIHRLMARPGLRARLGAAARSSARRFAAEQAVPLWTDLARSMAQP